MCYFVFINKNFTELVNQEFNSSECDISFMYPYFKDLPSENEDNRMVLVCVDKDTSTIRSFAINNDSI